MTGDSRASGRLRFWAVSRWLLPAAALVALALAGAQSMAAPVHGIAMHGTPKYGPDFQHLDYANPDAPKGGELRRAVTGTFDNLNPFIIKGVAAPGRHHFFESLLKRTWDEPFSSTG